MARLELLLAMVMVPGLVESSHIVERRGQIDLLMRDKVSMVKDLSDNSNNWDQVYNFYFMSVNNYAELNLIFREINMLINRKSVRGYG